MGNCIRACSYTLESSFAGADVGPSRGTHFTCRHFEAMGHHFCCALLDSIRGAAIPPPLGTRVHGRGADPKLVRETLRELEVLHPSKFITGEEAAAAVAAAAAGAVPPGAASSRRQRKTKKRKGACVRARGRRLLGTNGVIY